MKGTPKVSTTNKRDRIGVQFPIHKGESIALFLIQTEAEHKSANLNFSTETSSITGRSITQEWSLKEARQLPDGDDLFQICA
jgi:hypothetical protein